MQMYNLIRFEIYKLRRSKTFTNLLKIVTGLIVLTIVLSFFKSVKLNFISGIYNGKEIGFSINKFNDYSDPLAIEFFYSASSFTYILLILQVSLVEELIHDEYSKGTIKNLLAYGHKRWKVYLAKLLVMFLAIFILVIYLLFGTVILGIVINGFREDFKLTLALEMFYTTGLIWGILMAIASVYMFLAMAIRSSYKVIAIAIIFPCVSYIQLAIYEVAGYEQYLPTFMLVYICSIKPEINFIYLIIKVCSILIIISTILGIIVFKNQDIK